MAGEALHKNKLYFQVGLHVASKYPQVYEEIMTQYLHPTAADSDFANIAKYKEVYNQYQIKDQTIKSHFDIRRIFVSAMLRMYVPGVYNQKLIAVQTKYGFNRILSAAIGVNEPRTGVLIKQAITYEKIYDYYSNEVDSVVEFLTASQINKKAC